MKLVLGLSLVFSVNAFSYGFTDKNPELEDISVKTLIDHGCGASGHFNPAVCVSKADRCYTRASWPKTVDVKYKLTVVINCLAKAADI